MRLKRFFLFALFLTVFLLLPKRASAEEPREAMYAKYAPFLVTDDQGRYSPPYAQLNGRTGPGADRSVRAVHRENGKDSCFLRQGEEPCRGIPVCFCRGRSSPGGADALILLLHPGPE